jgi:hypothetical protein
MQVCDICKSNKVNYDVVATVNDEGRVKRLELCCPCYTELTKRENEYRHLAYIETIKARNGEIPHKSHWWDRLMEI